MAKLIRNESHKFKKGEVYHLDALYHLYGILPKDMENPFWDQDDISDSNWTDGNNKNDCGESIRILRDFTVSIQIYG